MQISAKYEKLRDARAVKKAEQFAGYTIPSLMANSRITDDNAAVLESDFQSTGALLVNNLTSKLVQALFPAGRPFHRIQIDAAIRERALSAGISEGALASGTAELERQSTEHLFRNAALGHLHRIIKQTIVTGDCLVYRDTQQQNFITWNRHNYVVRRNSYGVLREVILQQRLRPEELPAEQVQQYRQAGNSMLPEQPVEYYTHVLYSDNEVSIQPYIRNTAVGEQARYPLHVCPFIVVAWNIPSGEHYGRGYVEEYVGDFAKLSVLSEQLALYEVESLQMLNLVDETAGGATADEYQAAETGQFIAGGAKAVEAYERGDYNKMQAVQRSLQAVEMRLSQAFMYTANQRQAERVTAEEVRTVAMEAENLLGGTYSILAENLQTPLAYLCMYEVAMREDTEDLLYEIVRNYYKPEILTGIPALTQSTETQNLMRATAELSQVVPVLTELSRRFDPEKIIEMYMRANSVDLDALSKTPEQIEQEIKQEAEMQQQAAALGMEQEV